MNNYLIKYKKITAIFAIMVIFVLQNSGLILGLSLFSNNRKINVVNAEYSSTEITLSNSDFESPTSSAYPITPSGWLKIDSDEVVTSGLINVSQSVYDENYEDYNLTFNPGKDLSVDVDDNKVLMINAEETNCKMGYQSSSFVLSKNGYYTIEALVYTEYNEENEIDASASMYLTGNDQVEESANSKILAISTNGVWQTYKFFIETSSINNATLNLELYLGSKDSILSEGAVFFDNVKIYSHSNDRYYSEINNLGFTQTNYSILNLNEQKVLDAVVNADFEEPLIDKSDNSTWSVVTANDSTPNSEYAINGLFYIDGNFNSTLTGVTESPTNANIYGNTKALLINNINAASIGYKSSDILIEQHKLYKLSVWVKTSDVSATIKLIQQNPYGEDNTTYTPVSAKIENVNTYGKENEKTENWIQYSFLIEGSVFTSSYANLELWLGDDVQTQTGYAFFDNVELYELTTSQFTKISAGDTVKSVNFSNISGTSTVTNGNFNDVTVDDITVSYPYTVKDWTLSSDSTNYEYAQTKNGIINTKPSHFIANSDNYSTISNPGNLNNQINDEISNNILVIGNQTSTSQIYTSSNVTLSADSYYLFSFYIQTQGLSNNNVSVRLLNTGTAIYTLNKLESNLTWTKYSIYIKTSATNIDTSIELRLGSKEQEITGYSFFDNISMAKIESTDYDTAKIQVVDNTTILDLNYENFTGINATPTNGLYTPQNYTGTKGSSEVSDEMIQSGILDTANFNSLENNFAGLDNPNSADEDNSNILMIGALEDAYYYYTSKLTYSITKDTYYKFSIFVKTVNLNQLAENQELDDNNNVIPYGAQIYLTGFDGKFNAINTQTNSTLNEYQEYTFYILAASDKTFNVVLGLGAEDALTKGYAFFSNLSLIKIDEEDYTEQMTLLSSDNPPSNILNLENAITEEEEEETEDEENAGINFDFLLFPTLIFGLTLIIAIIGYSIRQIKFNKLIRKRIHSEIYDRNRTLAVDHERREVVKERQERLAKLKEQLSLIKSEINANEESYKLSKQEEVKEINLATSDKEKTGSLTAKELKAYKTKRKEAFRKEHELAYKEKRDRLQAEFERIEKEIEKLEREERVMFEKYRNYRAQIKAIKLEIKQKQKEARIKLKIKKQKEKEKRVAQKLEAKQVKINKDNK